MGTQVADAIEDARNRLLPLAKEQLNTLASTLSASGATATMTYAPRALSLGHTIAIGTEDMVVMDTPTDKTVTVARGQHGTVAQAHDAGSIVDEKPRYSRGRILRALYQEIQGWPPELYRVETTTISAGRRLRTYSLGLADQTDLLDVLTVQYDGGSSTVAGWKSMGFRLQRIGPPSISPGGDASIVLDNMPPRATDIWVEYAVPFDLRSFTAETQMVGGPGTVGLVASMMEPASLGAALRLLNEAARTDLETQTTRDPADVAAGLITSVRNDLRNEYKMRIQEERVRLQRRYRR